MRILQVIPYFVPAWDYGGPLQVCYALSKQLVSRGHELTVYTTDALDAKNRVKHREEITDGIRVKRFGNLSNTLAHQHHIFISPGMFLSMKEVKSFDIIHMHEYRTLQNAAVYHHARKYGIPYILQPHGSVSTYFQKGILKKVFDSLWGYRILKEATKLIAITPAEAEQYQSMGARGDRIEIVPNGLDLSEFSNLPPRGEFRRKYGLSEEQKVILYLGRIHKMKGLDILVRAFVGMTVELNDVTLAVVGPDDGYLPELRRLVKGLKLEERVLISGPLYERDKLEAYVDADVYVLPSSYETFPMTVLEAWACNVPVVISETCGIAGWVDGKIGIAIPLDASSLEDALKEVLIDNVRYKERIKKAAEELLNFSWDRIAGEIEEIYREASAGEQK